MAEEIGTTQNQIYRLEKPTTAKPTISTLKRIAAVFDVALVVRFVPFGQLVHWASGTPFLDTGLSTESLVVPSFAQEKTSTIPGQVRTERFVLEAPFKDYNVGKHVGQVSNVAATILTFKGNDDEIAMAPASPTAASIADISQSQAAAAGGV